jgi:SAM-dependent methyltransferase
MIEQYNKLARAEGFEEDRMSGVLGNLLDDTDSNVGEEYRDFDLIVMSMALHHVQDPDEMVKRLSERLSKGGVLLIVDWVSEAESGLESFRPPGDSPVRHTVSRFGFEEKEVKDAFKKVGLTGWDWRWFSSRSRLPSEFGGGEQQLFMARGTK